MKIPKSSQARNAAFDPRLLIVVVVLLGSYFVMKSLFFGGDGDGGSTAYHTIQRGDFLVSIVEGGEVSSVNETVLRCELDGTARIIYIIPEGTTVKEGELLVELDGADLVDKINAEQITFEKSQAAYTQAQASFEITKSTLMTQMRNASNALMFARLDLEKYLDGDYQQTLLTSSNDIVSFEQSLKVAKDKMDNSRKLFDKGFETLNNLERDQLQFTNQFFSLVQAKESLRLYQTYQHTKSLTTFESAVADAQDDLKRVELEGKGNIAAAEADLASQLNTLILNSNKLDRLKSQLDKSKIYAPQDGLVVYAVSSSRYSSESLIEEGATVRNRQEIIKLPDISKLKVDIKIQEANIGQVRPSQVAYVVLDTFPDQRHKAYVSKVGVVPEASSRWGGSDMKMYATEVRILDAVEGAKPGVSAQVEIITTNLTDVVTVPSQSVTTQKEKTVVYKRNGGEAVPVEVKLGVFDDKYIQIVSGVEPGDQVLLNPPLNYDADDLDGSVVRDGEKVDTEPVKVQEESNRANRSSATGEAGTRQNAKPANEGNGRESQSEGGSDADRRAEFIKRFDKDGDGQLSESEREAVRAALGGGSGGGGAGGGGGGQRGGGGGGRPQN